MSDRVADWIRENTTVFALVAIFMLLLLVGGIMISLAFVTKRVDIDLPRAESLQPAPEERVIVKVDPQGQYYLGIGSGKQEVLSSGELYEQIKNLRLKNPGLSVGLVIDKNLGYSLVTDALALLQKAEVNIELTSKQSDETALP